MISKTPCASAAAVLLALPLHSAPTSISTPQTVSPGNSDRSSEIATSCPTFNWGGVAGASAYELAIYELPEEGEPLPAELEPVSGAIIPGTALGWTPGLGRCLEPGRQYVWFVRALSTGVDAHDDAVTSDWSRGRRFRVRAAPSVHEVAQALDVLRRYVSSGPSPGPESPGEPVASQEAGPGAPGAVQPSDQRTPGAVTSTIGLGGVDTGLSAHAEIAVLGTSSSLAGAGLVAANTAGGADVILHDDSAFDVHSYLSELGIDRPSASAQSFDIGNSGGGGMTLTVNSIPLALVSHDHDSAYYQQSILNSAGTLNQAGNPVHWTKLKGMPAGFADGTDNDTVMSSGLGLKLIGTTLSINDSIVARKDSIAPNQIFDGGTLVLDYTNDRVGIGGTPSHELDVQGTTSSGDFRYQNPKVFVHRLPGAAFQPSTDGDARTVREDASTYYDDTQSTKRGFAVVSLPQGAEIRSLQCIALDWDPASDAIFEFTLKRINVFAGVSSDMAMVTMDSSGSTISPRVGTTTAITDATINNNNYGYIIQFDYTRDVGATNSPDLRNRGCTVQYELTTLGLP